MWTSYIVYSTLFPFKTYCYYYYCCMYTCVMCVYEYRKMGTTLHVRIRDTLQELVLTFHYGILGLHLGHSFVCKYFFLCSISPDITVVFFNIKKWENTVFYSWPILLYSWSSKSIDKIWGLISFYKILDRIC